MDEYISKQKVLDYLNGYLHSLGEGGTDDLLFDRGQRRALINSIQDISAVKAADVQLINPLVKVEERVPTVSGNYLCYLSNGEFEVLYFDREIEDDEYNDEYPFGVWNTYPSDDGGECREWIEVLEVTHWMPLPERPEE